MSDWIDVRKKKPPTDGTEFQAWWSRSWQPFARINPENGAFELWGRIDYDQDGWDVFSASDFTHWQPLPEPPQ